MLRYHTPLRDQEWTRYRIKDGEKGPMVWEAKSIPIYPKNEDGLPQRTYRLVVTRNVLAPDEVKYFVSNAPLETPLPTLLLVAFSRWRVERCFQAELTLVVFKTTLHPPPRKRHQQHGADRCLRRRVAHEEFDLIRIEHVAGDDQVQPRPRQAVGVFDRDEGMLTLPNHRSFRPVLDAPGLPGLITQGGLVQQLLDAACGSAATGQTWNGTAPTTECSPMRSASFRRSSGSGARSSAGFRGAWPPNPDSRPVM